MHHSYEGLDRSGGISRVRSVAPLRHRQFRLLWTGMCVSLLGDGAFLVAMAWQVYALSNAPTALALVGISMSVPTILLLLVGGVASDRFDRRRVMLAADVARGVAVGALALLSITGAIALWHVIVIVALYGAAQAFFDPAFDAVVPDVLPPEELGQANSLDQVVRPLALRLAGPALGGVLIDVIGTGGAFALDALSFAVSIGALLAMGPLPRRAAKAVNGSVSSDLLQGFAYVRRHTWLWGTFVTAAVSYLLFLGPTEVLLPYLVKEHLAGSGTDLGLVLGAGGVGSIACALAMGQNGIPRREILFMYLAWTLATVAIAGYGVASAIWQLMLVSLAFNAFETAGTIIWATAKQKHVPAALLGRVSSLDWLISIGLLPLSFALTGPVTSAIGVRTTLVGAGVLGACVTLAGLLLPGMRAIEGASPAARPEVARELPAQFGV